MEVMTSLLLFVLVAFPPQALGKQKVAKPLKFNNTLVIRQPTPGHRLLLNQKEPKSTADYSKMKNIYQDPKCIKCLACMDRALKANNMHRDYPKFHAEVDSNYQVITNEVLRRKVRSIIMQDKADMNMTNKSLKPKERKKKAKCVSVTKYKNNGATYALIIRETSKKSQSPDSASNNYVTTCTVYQVKKAMNCDTIGAMQFQSPTPKRETKRTTVEEVDKNTSGGDIRKYTQTDGGIFTLKQAKTTTEKSTAMASKAMQDWQIPEGVTSSFEQDMY